MKRKLLLILIMGIMLTVPGCVYSNNFDDSGKEMNEEEVRATIGEIIDNIKSEINNAISGHEDSNILETTIDLDLTTEYTEVFSLNLVNDTEATIRYTYSTDDKDNVVLGCINGDSNPMLLELLPATEDSYNVIWNEEDITLKKGDNTFYLTGNGAHCKMILQIDGINEENIIYSGTVNEK